MKVSVDRYMKLLLYMYFRVQEQYIGLRLSVEIVQLLGKIEDIT